jgi:hypothetical protein
MVLGCIRHMPRILSLHIMGRKTTSFPQARHLKVITDTDAIYIYIYITYNNYHNILKISSKFQ